MDIIIANKVGENIGFDSDENAVTILCKNDEPIELSKTKKTILAKQIIELVYKISN